MQSISAIRYRVLRSEFKEKLTYTDRKMALNGRCSKPVGELEKCSSSRVQIKESGLT